MSLCNPFHTLNLFRRERSGGALTALEGSACDMSQANALACSDNFFDIISHTDSTSNTSRPFKAPMYLAILIQAHGWLPPLQQPIHLLCLLFAHRGFPFPDRE